MNGHKYLTRWVIGAVALVASAVAVGSPASNFYELVGKIDEARTTNSQAKYSRQLHQSINAGTVRHLTEACAAAHPGSRVGTFSVVGMMRLDGVIKEPTVLPDNDFTQCVAGKIDVVSFPLPPGSGRGWPVAMQFDTASGKVLYVAGDSQRVFPQYRAEPGARATPWIYTPVPPAGPGMEKSCEMNVWLSIGVEGTIEEVDVADSTCSTSVSKAIEDAAGQWLYRGKAGSSQADAHDVRLSFSIISNRIRVNL